VFSINNLALIKSSTFSNVQCDFYQDSSKEVLMTRKQIGEALGYADPQKAIDSLHAKHKERLDRYSVTFKVRGTDGKLYDTCLYAANGIYEICRWSQQPKADAFYDFVYGILESLRKGEAILQYQLPATFSEALRMLADEVDKRETLQVEVAQQKQIIGELQPKACYYDTILNNSSVVPITKIAKDYGMSGYAMNTLLHELGVQYRMGDTWLLYQQYASMGYTQSWTHLIDVNKNVMHTYWTQKGRLFLYDLLKTERKLLPSIECQAAISC
jgi:phage antirepressor YoqD-like protein